MTTAPVAGHRRGDATRSSSRARPSSLPGRSGREPSAPTVVVGGAEEHELAVGQPRQDRVDVAERRASGRASPSKSSTTRRTSSTAAGSRPRQLGRRGVVGAVDLDLRPRLDQAVARPGTCRSTSVEAVARRRGATTSIGWTSRWTPRPWRSSTMRIVSTRNGMSSVTTSSTECGECQPSRSRSGDSTRATACPGGRTRAEGEVGDGDGVDVVELAVVDVALRQLGVVAAAGTARAARRRAGAGRPGRTAARAPRPRRRPADGVQLHVECDLPIPRPPTSLSGSSVADGGLVAAGPCDGRP